MPTTGDQDEAPADVGSAVFISYTHIDDQPFGPDQLRWVSHFHEQLDNRVDQLFGGAVTVWRDEKLQGNDVFAETLKEQLGQVAVLVSVCSPRYLNSEWCQRELDEFLNAAEARGGVQVGTRSRVFKVLKTPIPLEETPQQLTPLLGYEFYEDAEGARPREFLLNPDPEERWKFYARVDDLANDIANLLQEIAAASEPVAAAGRTVYLAETTSDVAPERDDLRRELERHGHVVLPQRALPFVAEDLTAVVTEELEAAAMSIHLLGSRHGIVPEGEIRSVPQIQLDLAAGKAAAGGLTQLIWLATDVAPEDDGQAALLGDLERSDLGPHAELVRSPLEAFKTYALELMDPPAAPPAAAPAPAGGKRVYLMHDPADRQEAVLLQEHLAALGHVAMLPLGEGTEAEMREIHEMSMVLSDAVLVYYGDATEHWVRMKLFDVLKAPGWGRQEPFQAQAVLLGPPASPAKAAYSTTEALVLDATAGFQPAVLQPFLDRLAGPTT